MFSINDIFTQVFPWLEGISWDLGTVLTSIIFLWFLILGFDLLKVMLFGHLERERYSKWADRYFETAEEIRAARDTNQSGSTRWLEQDMLYKKFLKKSVDARAKGWRH